MEKTMTNILAIDPGTTKSGWCYIVDGDPKEWGWFDNEKIYTLISAYACQLVIEDVAHFGMPVGKDVFETVRWTGRFDRHAEQCKQPVTYVSRPEVKLALCGSPRANDSTIRQAVIDRFGGDEIAVGGKKCKTCKGKGWNGRDHIDCADCITDNFGVKGWHAPPGILYGISGHVWSALAVGLTHHDMLLVNRV